MNNLEAVYDNPVIDHLSRAEAAGERGDHVVVVDEARICIDLRPKHPRAYYLMGMALMKLGWMEDAEHALLVATEQQDGFGEAHAALADFYKRRRRDLFMHGHHRMLAIRAGVPAATLDGE